MTIDFDLEVLSPLIDLTVFGRIITIIPYVSQPGALGYQSRGVWEADPYTIIQENQAPLATSQFRIGLRMRDYTVQPDQGDHIVVDGLEYVLSSPEWDGQGGVMWTVKAVSANQSTPFLPPGEVT